VSSREKTLHQKNVRLTRALSVRVAKAGVRHDRHIRCSVPDKLELDEVRQYNFRAKRFAVARQKALPNGNLSEKSTEKEILPNFIASPRQCSLASTAAKTASAPFEMGQRVDFVAVGRDP